MKRVMTAVLALSLSGAPFLVGCDKEIKHDETTTKNPDGTMTKDSTTVKQEPDGTIVKQHDVNHDANQ